MLKKLLRTLPYPKSTCLAALGTLIFIMGGLPPGMPVSQALAGGVAAEKGQLDEPFSIFGLLVNTHRQLSERIVWTAAYVDAFFVNRQSEEEQNNTQFTARLSADYADKGEFSVDPDFRLRLNLPALEEKLNLTIFSGDTLPDFTTTADDEKKAITPVEDATETSDSVTGLLEYFVQAGKSQHVKFQVGGDLNLSPSVYGGVRYRYFKEVGGWGLRFTQTPRWYTDKGWESRTALDHERRINEAFFFRVSNDVNLSEEDGLYHVLSFSLYHYLTRTRAIKYEWYIKSAENDILEIDSVGHEVRFRQNLWRNFVFLSVTPWITWHKTEEPHREAGITIQLETIFGVSGTS